MCLFFERIEALLAHPRSFAHKPAGSAKIADEIVDDPLRRCIGWDGLHSCLKVGSEVVLDKGSRELRGLQVALSSRLEVGEAIAPAFFVHLLHGVAGCEGCLDDLGQTDAGFSVPLPLHGFLGTLGAGDLEVARIVRAPPVRLDPLFFQVAA